MAPINRRLLREHIYEDVLKRIMHGHFQPGSRLRDTIIADELQVSRTPVREALVRLSQDGHLHADAGRGFKVRTLTPQEVRDLYPVAWTLEILALRTSGSFSVTQLARLREINAELGANAGSVEERISIDESWHRTLLEGCANGELLQLIDTVKRRLRVYEHAYWYDASVADSVDQHSRILSAIESGDIDEAATVLEENFSKTMERLLSSLTPAV